MNKYRKLDMINSLKRIAKGIVCLIAIILLIQGCNSPRKVLYLQDVKSYDKEKIANYQDIRIRPNDRISIIVSSKEPTVAAVYNLQSVSTNVTTAGMTTSSGTSTYIVDSEGCINFPVLGRIPVSGLTRSEVQAKLTTLLRDGHVKDAVVIVQLHNFNISVLGEVAKPGKYNIDNDRVTILDAIAMAGDMTIYGRRDSVLVIRETLNGEREYMYCNILNSDFTRSPAFYLQQNDMVYVKPNPSKARQGDSASQFTQVSLWVSIASFLTTLAVVIFK